MQENHKKPTKITNNKELSKIARNSQKNLQKLQKNIEIVKNDKKITNKSTMKSSKIARKMQIKSTKITKNHRKNTKIIKNRDRYNLQEKLQENHKKIYKNCKRVQRDVLKIRDKFRGKLFHIP